MANAELVTRMSTGLIRAEKLSEELRKNLEATFQDELGAFPDQAEKISAFKKAIHKGLERRVIRAGTDATAGILFSGVEDLVARSTLSNIAVARTTWEEKNDALYREEHAIYNELGVKEEDIRSITTKTVVEAALDGRLGLTVGD